MPSFPPASAFRAAHTRHQAALEAMLPATLIIDGRRITAAGKRGPVTEPFDNQGGGARLVQTLTATIQKTDLRNVALEANKTRVIFIDPATRAEQTFVIREIITGDAYAAAVHIVAARKVTTAEVVE